MVTISEKLVAMGWTSDESKSVRCAYVGGNVSVSPKAFTDKARFASVKTDLATLLGAEIDIPGDGKGTVEVRKGALYIGGQHVAGDSANIEAALRDLMSAGALVAA